MTHRSVSSVETDIRTIFALRVGLLVFYSLVRNLDWPPFGKAPLLSLNPSGLPLPFRRASRDYTARQCALGQPLFAKALLLCLNPSAHPLHRDKAGRDYTARQR